MRCNMFLKKNESIEFANKIMKKSRIPILIYDQQWKKLFANSMNKSMETLSKDLQQLLTEEKELEHRLKSSQGRKRILMNKIIHLSDRLNSKGEEIEISDIEDAKDEIAKINEEIDEIRENLELYPQKIESTNMELLKETAKVAYSEINNTQARLSDVDEEINILREKLGQYWDEKEALEEKVQVLYSLLHSIIGPEEIEKLDVKFLQR